MKVDENEVEKEGPNDDGEDQMSVKSSSELAPLKNTAQFSGNTPDVHPLAVKLGKQGGKIVARNILVLYKANMNAQRKLMEESSRISSKTSVASNMSSVVNEENSRGSSIISGGSKLSRSKSKKKIWEIT